MKIKAKQVKTKYLSIFIFSNAGLGTEAEKVENSLRFSFLLPVTRWFADRLNQELYCKNWFDMFSVKFDFSGNIELISLIFTPTDAFLI